MKHFWKNLIEIQDRPIAEMPFGQGYIIGMFIGMFLTMGMVGILARMHYFDWIINPPPGFYFESNRFFSTEKKQ